MNENERIVCEFLRKIAPSREWEYLGEVEHYWIGELCDELKKPLKDENTKLRELVNGLTWCCEHSGCDNRCQLYDRSEPDHCRENLLKQELGIKED